jgi:predicted TIM-barrel fold metal-dependent hydrolase
MEETSGWRTRHDGTLAGLLGSMDVAGVETSLILPVATNPEKVSSVNRFSATVSEPRVVMAGALHPGSPAWRDDLDELLRLGFRVIKLHPDYQGFFVDEPEWRPFFAAIRDAGIRVVFHAGADPSYEPPFGATPGRIGNLLDQLPGLQASASHFGGFQAWDEVEQCLMGREELVMDTSYSFEFLPKERIIKIIRSHGIERIMFGTDSPWLDQAEQVGNILQLGMSDDETERVLYLNARRMIDEWQTQAAEL